LRLARVFLRSTRWLDANVERSLMLVLYAFIAAIVGGEAVWRYLANAQTQWGGTAAIHAFIFLSWLGCAYHVRLRSHIRFDGLRARLSPRGKLIWYLLDDSLWLAMAVVVIHHSTNLVEMHRSLGATLEGTDDFPYWIAVAAVPLGWLLIAIRALQDAVLLFADYRAGRLSRTGE
jgi:TRAP-type C4-dicarboxylate transport system permease small subunit